MPRSGPRQARGALPRERLPERGGHRRAGLFAGDGGMALAQELHAVVPPGGVRLLGTGHPHQQLRKLRQALALAQQREHQLVLQPVELQVGERLPRQGGLQEGVAALQLFWREVGRKAVDQPDALGVWRGSIAEGAGEFRIN